MSEILTDKENSILTITLNRPEKRNALNADLIKQLTEALLEADKDESLYAIVIKGAGKDFCSGADLAELQKIADNSFEENLADAENLAGLFALIRKTSVPVIAAVHGKALAGGCGLATACDIVLAARSARFGYPEVKIGFVPAMVAAILRRNLSEKRAFELLTQGFDFPAEEAERIGLINAVFDDETFEDEIKNHISVYEKVSRSAVVLSKKLLYQMDGMDFETALKAGAKANAHARQSEDCRAGIKRFLEKQNPT